MELTLKGRNKRGTQALYVGLSRVLRISTNNFENRVPPDSFSVEGAFVAKPVVAPRVKLTAAERVVRMEKRLATLKAKLEMVKTV